MSFTQKIAQSVLATHDLHELVKLDTTSSESQGILLPRIEGDFFFNNIPFSYPTNPNYTSALHSADQTAGLETTRAAKIGRTTIMVTHKVPVMKTCDRILVVEDGQVREQGMYESLMESKGLFARLANGEEWVGE
ncbi:hypothetical protein BDR07DRAFT_1610978 [Suillus spraguei]|nr:hypothetical protein BDR07DRAFT_1610978 [Suillus spraguei]